MSALDRLLERMQSQTEESLAAARAGDIDACAEALTRRDATLREIAQRMQTPAPEEAQRLAAAAERVQTQDAELVALLERSRDEARSDLDRVSAARRIAQNAAGPAEPARFVCERV